ncbi:MAG: hypothetical protein K2K98_13165 [Muribaculaceae bacterium]|nr:hypothetical protein [Muribaculaceae bacterium]
MKRILILLMLSLAAVGIRMKAENSGQIAYYPVVIGEGVPEASKKLLVSKMEQAMLQYGLGSMDHADRFVMLAKCNVLQKDVAPTTPPRISQKVEVTFIIGDVIENKTFASESMNLSGIGINETKAWQTAINGIKSSNPIFSTIFEHAYDKISMYYLENCTNIIDNARTLALTGNYDGAIATLMATPEICYECYEKAMKAAVEIYQDKIDKEGTELLSKAKHAWAVSQDEKGADQAIAYLNEISVSSSSFADAEKLAALITEKVSSDKEREWQLKLQQYKDELEFRKKEQADSHRQSMASIAAARSVAEKWAENQPETKVYYNW